MFRRDYYLVIMSGLHLSIPKEFSHELNFQFLKRSPKEVLHRINEDVVTKLIPFKEEKVLVQIKPGKEKLLLNFLNGEPSASAKQHIRNYVVEWFDLETDLKPFYAMAGEDKLLGPLVGKFHGYRIIGQPDLFESIIWAVLGQQINLQFAYTLKQRFVEQFGEQLIWDNTPYFLF